MRKENLFKHTQKKQKNLSTNFHNEFQLGENETVLADSFEDLNR